MPEVMLCGHPYIHAVSDILRMYYDSVKILETKGIGETPSMTLKAGDDGWTIRSRLDGDQVTTCWELSNDQKQHDDNQIQNGDSQIQRMENCIKSGPVTGNSAKREVKRQIYLAVASITGMTFPWGSLTGIRPTLVASECKSDPSRLKNHYLVSESKAALAFEVCNHEERILSGLPADLYHAYIGIPFCRSRCLYCSFVSEEYQRLEKWIPGYVDALVKEIDSGLPLIEQKLQTLYIGGGTPTSLPDDLFDRLLSEIAKHLTGPHFKEFTVEAGRADSITESKLRIMKRYGVRRICINPQTMQDRTLRRIGRNHTATQVRDTFALARDAGFDTINMDLIAGLPGESFVDFKDSLDELLLLSPENITVHTLSLKRNSTLARSIQEECHEFQKFHIPNLEISDMIEYSGEVLKNHGYHPYYLYRQKDTAGGHENTGYSKTGKECLYNVAMMGDQNSVMAFGAGAISKKAEWSTKGHTMTRLPNLKDIQSYINQIDERIERKRLFFTF